MFAVVKKIVTKWIAKECKGYEIAGIKIKGIDDEIHIVYTEKDIRKMVVIQSAFAT